MNIDLFGNIILDEVAEQKEVKTSPFVYMTYVQNKKYPDGFDDYSPFLTNLGFSQRKDTVLYANELNKYSDLGSREQFDFYYHSLPKKNFFSKWVKTIKTEETQMVMDYFKVSYKVAKQYEMILQPKQMNKIKDWYNTHKGGK
jgi:hypothetical protein